MNKALTITTILLAVIALILLGYYFTERSVSVPAIIEQRPDLQTYTNAAYGISFSYSQGYFLKELNAGTGERPQLAVILTEDTQENRDVIEGRVTEPRDGPTAITVDVYPNPDRLTAEDWVRADTNWTIRTTEAAPIGRGSIAGVTYSWSGLYEGKTVIVTRGTRTYVFSVTWLEETDAILQEFDSLLASVELAP